MLLLRLLCWGMTEEICVLLTTTKNSFYPKCHLFPVLWEGIAYIYINHVYNLDYRLCQNKPQLEIVKNYDFLSSVRSSILVSLIVQARIFVNKLQTAWVFQLWVTHKTHSEVKRIHNVRWSLHSYMMANKQTGLLYLFHDIWHAFLQVSFLPTKW